MTEFCGRCRFWEFVKRPRNYALGNCLRRAPVPTPYLIHMIAELISNDEDYHNELKTTIPDVPKWPITYSCEWCGEFELRPEPTNLAMELEAIGGRMAAAERWETEAGLDSSDPLVESEVHFKDNVIKMMREKDEKN